MIIGIDPALIGACAVLVGSIVERLDDLRTLRIVSIRVASITPRAAAAAIVAAQIKALTPDTFASARQKQLAYMTEPQNLDTAETFSNGASVPATATYMQELMSADVRDGLSKVSVPLLEIAPFDATIDPNNPFEPMPTLDAKKAYYEKLLANDSSAKVEMVDHSRQDRKSVV